MFRCILCLCERVCDHDRHGLADETDTVYGKHRHRCGNHRLSVASDSNGNGRDSAKSVGREIGSGDHRDDPGHGARPRHIDMSDARVARRGTHKHAVSLIGGIHVVSELTAAR